MAGGFRIPGKDRSLPLSTIDLFRRLNKLERLSLEQGESLKEYEELRNGQIKDFAIEMPAGHGKTLVGGLIGEFNRLTKDWRIVYICATRQLASQTHKLLSSYGIESVLLTGKSSDFSEADYGKYARSAALSVTTYNHIFNINPWRFKDAHQIIIDDAHAADNAISKFWSVSINKKFYETIFDSVFAILRDAIPPHIQDKVTHGYYDPLTDAVDVIPLPLWCHKIEELRSALDALTDDTDLYFPWSQVRNNLHTCQIYVSYYTIVIRPVLLPNLKHQAFAQAKERIYMSATVGHAGELERSFGVESIHRISKFPPGSNKVSGRRLIMFPEDHFGKDGVWDAIESSIRMQPRVLILCPSDATLKDVSDKLQNLVPEYCVFFAKDIEESLHKFVEAEKGILLLAGRYEGIDLKDEDCRLQIIYGLPVAVGIPEQFFQSRLRATEILKGHLLTRITQGLGRCTRGTKDYAAVLFVGKRVGEYLYKEEFRRQLPAEIDAEIQFGFDQIDFIQDMSSWENSLRMFFNQSKDWTGAEEYIKNLAEQKVKNRLVSKENTALGNAVSDEIKFMYALWDKNYEQAQKSASEVLVHLSREKGLNGYRAWWNYMIACVSALQGEKEKVTKFLDKAIQASPNKTWLDRRALNIKISEATEEFPEDVETQVNLILRKLENYGDRDKRFEKDWERLITGLADQNAKHFEPALRDLGDFLGFNSERPKGDGAPDSIWNNVSAWLAFEAKTTISNPDSGLALEDIRQASFHYEWTKKYKELPDDIDLTVIVISARNYIERSAEHAIGDLFIVTPQEILNLAKGLGEILLNTIQKLKFASYDEARILLVNDIFSKGFYMKALKEDLTRKPLGKLPVGLMR